MLQSPCSPESHW